ncbi:hypothetical protein [Sinorhizobium meliloti]|uniref:hypothetical protein n=1 Tax=Rhizobium meliloti TaxID=382 RepID=UPI0013E3FA6B|nr:hypothetical protein [Sinorhizobium meliloti]
MHPPIRRGAPADPKSVAFRVPALGAFEQRPKLVERDVEAILSSDGPSVNPLVVVAPGAARAEQLIVREIGEPQVTDAAIRINGSLFRDQIDSASMAHRPLFIVGASYEDGVAIPVLALLASHSPLEAKDSLTFAEPRSQRPPIQPVDVTAAPALA